MYRNRIWIPLACISSPSQFENILYRSEAKLNGKTVTNYWNVLIRLWPAYSQTRNMKHEILYQCVLSID